MNYTHTTNKSYTTLLHLGAAKCIISIAQQASPKVRGHNELFLAQLIISSTLASAYSAFTPGLTWNGEYGFLLPNIPAFAFAAGTGSFEASLAFSRRTVKFIPRTSGFVAHLSYREKSWRCRCIHVTTGNLENAGTTSKLFTASTAILTNLPVPAAAALRLD